MSVVPEYVLRGAEYPFDKDVFLSHLDKIPELSNRRVLFFDGDTVHEIRPVSQTRPKDSRIVLIRPMPEETTLHSSEAAESRDSRFFMELLSVGLSCGAAVVSWIAVGSSAAAAPVTGGTSTFVTVLTYTAATASSAQCLNSSVRVYNEASQPEVNDWLDSQDWYSTTSVVLDVISLAGAAGAAGATMKAAAASRNATGKSMKEVLAGLNRAERTRLTEEIIRAQNPGISNRMLKQFVRSGVYPRRFSELHISNYLKNQLQNALASALSFSGSASGGLVRRFAVAIIEEVDVELVTPQPSSTPVMKRYEPGRAW